MARMPTIRRLTVSRCSSGCLGGSFPYIRLKGRWLETAGFLEGSCVKISVEEGMLVITPDTDCPKKLTSEIRSLEANLARLKEEEARYG